MAVSAQERRYLLSQVNKLAEAELNQLWQQAARLSTVEFFQYIVGAYPIIVDPYVDMAATLSATWFELSAPESAYKAITAPPLPAERLEASARWALKAEGDQGRVNLTGSLNRAVFDGARDTTLINVERTESRWVRHARPDACPFCRMLATRHSDPDMWYTSNDAALQVVGRGGRPRGNRKIGEEYHDHCRCIAVEVREGQEYEPPNYVQKWDDEYNKAVANATSGGVKDIMSAWRNIVTTES